MKTSSIRLLAHFSSFSLLLFTGCFGENSTKQKEEVASVSQAEDVKKEEREMAVEEVEKSVLQEESKPEEEVVKEKITLDSGLAYQTLQEPAEDAASPVRGKKITVHYTGWLNKDGEPGQKFDSSVDRGQTFAFEIGVGRVIRGWDEGVLTMKVGEKRRLFIPSSLGYGSRGAGNVIPPNADLIFDVELISI